MISTRLPGLLVAFGALALTVSACASSDESDTAGSTPADASPPAGSSPPAEAAACEPGGLDTLEEGTLTFGTSDPAFEPWMVGNDPANGEGYESAVAYALAEELGYATDDVAWVRVPFDVAIAPGPKDFDVAINQFSITEERRQAVDFSSPYYDVRQTVIAVEGSPAVDATSIADLQDVVLGAQVGTTSLAAIEESVQPSTEPQVFNDNTAATLALSNGQIDALVVDLPTAFFLTAVELEGGVVVGQLPELGGETEQFGLVLDLGSPLTDCVSDGVDELRNGGVLAELEQEWLADVAGAPELG